MSKHTPGPWRWMESELNKRLAHRLGRNRSKLRKQDGVLVYALMGPYNGPHEPSGDEHDYATVMVLHWYSLRGDSVNNASPNPVDRSLIAAAPDLLAACRAIVRLSTSAKPAERWRVMIGEVVHSGHDSRAEATKQIRRIRAAAIARAEGTA